MALQQLIDNFFTDLEGSRAQFTTRSLSPSRSLNISRMRMADGVDVGILTDSNLHKRTTVFGFVPVFSSDGSVKIYVRFGGGPELLRKGQSVMDVESLSDFTGIARQISKTRMRI